MNFDLTIIIPTFNERNNVCPLLERLDTTLQNIRWEAVFVDDDSPDATADLVRRIGSKDPRVRCIQRIGRRGLSSACIEGMLSSSTPYFAVMDADLQHDESLLPQMLRILQTQDKDIVIGSRYIEGGSVGEWDSKRIRMSRFATYVGRVVVKADLSDPMSGFFMLRSEFFAETVRHMTGKGFKILLDLFASAQIDVRFEELSYHFRKRHSGASKLDTLVVWEYFVLILDKIIGRFIPLRFVMFVTVGCVGALVHILILGLFLRLNNNFLVSQTVATFFAMTVNFVLNNLFTYRDQRLQGLHFVKGLFIFYFACSIGAFINVLIANFLFGHNVPWWLSGLLGATVGAVWNYAISSTFAWTGPQKLQDILDQSKYRVLGEIDKK